MARPPGRAKGCGSGRGWFERDRLDLGVVHSVGLHPGAVGGGRAMELKAVAACVHGLLKARRNSRPTQPAFTWFEIHSSRLPGTEIQKLTLAGDSQISRHEDTTLRVLPPIADSGSLMGSKRER
ncbi:hypothetical protein F511_13577 [Dorcoceras hygrometricum]|uniref:Uncharacterized protein n=1 Tax=Dorcoceras hygrometricum TaxID=472368 RepID=A0A2Z7BUK0_9LAMI|nr:hypothetical protein F511_13577 [Dorcoceras hygrometricum]